MKIALAHYSGTSEISSVNTWLIVFIRLLLASGHTLALLLYHFGPYPEVASIPNNLQSLPIELYAVCRSGSLERDTRQTMAFLNQAQPHRFQPQCLHNHYLAAAHIGRQELHWVFAHVAYGPQRVLGAVPRAAAPRSTAGRPPRCRRCCSAARQSY